MSNKTQGDIRNFFFKRQSSDDQSKANNDQETKKSKPVAKRSLVVVSSDDDEQPQVKEQTPSKKKKISPKKSAEVKKINPQSFFQSGSVKQSSDTHVKIIKKDPKPKKNDSIEEDEYGLDIDIDQDLLQAVEQVERNSQNVIETFHNVLTEKNVVEKPKPVAEKNVIAVEKSKPVAEKIKKSPASKDQKPITKKPEPTRVKDKAENIPPSDLKRAEALEKDESDLKDGENSKKSAGFRLYLQKQANQESIVRTSREPPVGAPDCFLGMSFVFTGELGSLDREAAQNIIKRYGGKTPSSISKKTSYVVAGSDPGPSKVKKAKDLGIKMLDEDAFYDLVNSFGPTAKAQTTASSSDSIPSNQTATKSDNLAPKQPPTVVPAMPVASAVSKGKLPAKASNFSSNVAQPPSSNLLWTDKYKPKSYDEVIGNGTNVTKLAQWLKDWQSNRAKGFPKSGKGEHSSFRAALLSGPPGIGKTTAAHLVAKTEGFEAIEFNASDTRSKKALDSIVKEATLTRSVTDLFTGKKKTQKVIIMDEVDGMSAGDRGGSAELIQLIKKTATPIICICNDHSSPKMRTLANHCLDLRFRRATAAMVEKRMSQIASKEKLTLRPNVVGELVSATSGDIRQIINILSTYRLGADTLTYDQTKELTSTASKNVNLTPFDVISKLMARSSFRSSTFSDKMDLYFQDYSLIPLFVQENYIKMNPSLAVDSGLSGRKLTAHSLKLLSEAADSISDSDILDASQRNENSFGLLPIHATLSTIRPCFFTHGSLQSGSFSYGAGGGYAFPSWLGQNSKQNKTKRLLREIQTHMRLLTSADKNQILLNYLPVLAPLLTRPLAEKENDGIEEVIRRMDYYYLNREDWDSILEFGYQKLLTGIPTKVKTAFTRTYNKSNHPNPFTGESSKASSNSSIAKAGEIDCEEVLLDDVVDDEEEEEVVEDIPKANAKKATKASSSKSSAKGKAKK